MAVTDGDSLSEGLGKKRKRSSRVVILAAVLVAILIIGAVAWLTVQSSNKKSEHTTHSPISIVGNANFTAANGVIGGSGNTSDPYIIANWDIDASNSVGICIESADAYFIVRNCHVHGGSTRPGSMQVGINLDNCSNGTLTGNECSGNLIGVCLYGLSNNNTVVNNSCNSNDQNGMALYLSNNNTLIGNECLSNGRWGIVLDSSSNNIVCNNAILHNIGFGICINPYISQTSTRNRLWNNTLIGNNGATNTYDASHVQAYDNGADNRWSSTNGYGNYWGDWLTPDNLLPSGIVDNPYSVGGGGGGLDYYPLTGAPVERQYFPHDTIFVNRDSEFIASNGVTYGNGTASDPYVIEGWKIDASSAHGIRVWNTTAFFIVRNCFVYNGGSDYFGVFLYNCRNGCLSNNTCSGNGNGIYLDSSSNNTLTDNICSSNLLYGIALESSTDNTLGNNICHWNGEFAAGIALFSSSDNNTLSNNNCNSNGWRAPGIALLSSSDNTLSKNACSNSQYGIRLDSSNNNSLSDNNCDSNIAEGIYLNSSSDNKLSNNSCNSNSFGMILDGSSNNVLINNSCSSNSDIGMFLYASDRNTLIYNNCSSNNRTGICLYALSDNNEVSRNMVLNNVESGVNISLTVVDLATSNHIWNNTFIGNNGAASIYDSSHVQAYDSGMNNWWNSTDGYGNYWSDWQSPSLPYDISGTAGAKDLYPLATPPAPS